MLRVGALGGTGGQSLFRGRRGWGFFHRVGNLIGNLTGGFFELLDALAKAFGQFRQLLRAKQDQDQGENKNNLAAAQIKKAKHYIHTREKHVPTKLSTGTKIVKTQKTERKKQKR